ncbi:alpha/beta fold hydrolase [Embleya hyalina]|uniref:Putative lipase n=1 Tax=Embleya hyalina TaxID=516124 RepID=A0A401YCR7_9ACTN|nr:alpha/beta fold hydrolase [Embleya hyalina]GCD92387.1 putative lipase [Embleya hyalina]
MTAPERVVPPEGDDFYVPPVPLPPGEYGDVIRSRPLTGVAALRSASHNELVLYRSEAVDGTPIAVSGIVALPPTPVPDGGYPLIGWAHGTLGLGDKCAPSRDNEEIAAELPEHHEINQSPHVLLNALLEAGWAVAMTDYEGMGTPGPHPFLLGRSEAHGVLDLARAARRLYPVISDRFALVGHSQGGQGALFAAHHADRIPEFTLLGVAALAPASHIVEDLIAGSDYDGYTGGLAFTPLLLTGAIIGSRAEATEERPAIDALEVLSTEAYTLFTAADDRCRVELSACEAWGGIKGNAQFRGSLTQDPNPHQREFLRQVEHTNPALSIPVPIRVSHAQRDERVKIAYSTRLVAELGELGNDVLYRIHARVADGGSLGAHFGLIETDVPELLAWLRDLERAKH